MNYTKTITGAFSHLKEGVFSKGRSTLTSLKVAMLLYWLRNTGMNQKGKASGSDLSGIR
ncbi:hypothetical protein WMZ97_00125 [Lentibacillus sp. N15]